MSNPSRPLLLRSAALGLILMMPACSGGGGSGAGALPPPRPAPTPTPTPTPAPTPTPTSNNDTVEYRASLGPVSANALTAYDLGFTGAGITVGVIDSGLDLGATEFPGRISAASQSTAGNGSYDDVNGHGTAVAFTVAGRRNGVGTHGIAFDATILALRTDTPGSCAGEDPSNPDSGCSHADGAIARAIDVARTNDARVINISLGGSPPANTVIQALNRATQAGIIVVISAGNDGEAPEGANPDPFTSPATNAAVSRGLIIIAGSVNTNDRISTFSNRAGTGASAYLAAVGERVRAPCMDTSVCLWSGTSFSAPQISGAVALLAQAYPNLTSAEIVQILFTSARDAGAAGDDAVYGQGILDLTRAFSPLGGTSVAGSSVAVSTVDNGTLGAAMGDAATPAGTGVAILDGFDRAFALDLSQTLRHSGPVRTLDGLLRSDRQRFASAVGETAVAVTIAQRQGQTRIERTLLPFQDAQQARAIAASVTGRLGKRASFAIGASEGSDVLGARLSGRADPAFLVARDPTLASGLVLDSGGAAAVRRDFGAWGVTVAAESGSVIARDPAADVARQRYGSRFGYDRWQVGIDRQWGDVSTELNVSSLREADTVLGARFGSAIGAAGAQTRSVDAAMRYQNADGWTVGGAYRRGWTEVSLDGPFEGSGRLATTGFSVDVGKSGLFTRSDFLGLRIAQPLRVASGGLDLLLPSEFDQANEQVTGYQFQRLNLAPQGREIDAEIGYSRTLWGGFAELNLFYRRDPGHFAAIPDDKGLAARFAFGF